MLFVGIQYSYGMVSIVVLKVRAAVTFFCLWKTMMIDDDDDEKQNWNKLNFWVMNEAIQSQFERQATVIRLFVVVNLTTSIVLSLRVCTASTGN